VVGSLVVGEGGMEVVRWWWSGGCSDGGMDMVGTSSSSHG